MRLSWGLVLGLTLGASAGRIVPRQNDASTTGPSPASPSTGGGNEAPTTPSSSGIGSSSSASPTTGGGDTTVFVTATVTSAGGGSIVSETTTVTSSSVTTVTVTTTDIDTTTITLTDGQTSTKTVFFTSTQTVNMKRSVDGVFHFVGSGPAHVDAQPTVAPTVTGVQGGFGPGRIRMAKRAVFTSTVTVTVGGGGSATAVTQTITKNVRSTTTTVVHVTSLITETYQANAKTTVTVTSTIVTKLTIVSTGVVETSPSTPTGNPSPGNSNNNNNDNGLSTGAKAGIGVGAGVAGLAIIGALLWFFTRRRHGPKPDPDDLLGPSSEVPVGAGGSRPMSEGLASTPGSVPHRSPVLPNVQPEGYRGTAKGDGRAGYAKPEPYGAAYAPTRSTTNSSYPPRSATLSPGDQLPRHPTPDTTTAASVSPLSARSPTAELGNDGAGARWHTAEAAEMATDNPAAAKWHSDNAHEIDSHAVMSHQSGPVYEMPTEHFR